MGVTAKLVGVTGNALFEDQQAFIAAGVDAVLTKPCTAASLTAMLHQLGLAFPPKPTAIPTASASAVAPAQLAPGGAVSTPRASRHATPRTPRSDTKSSSRVTPSEVTVVVSVPAVATVVHEQKEPPAVRTTAWGELLDSCEGQK